MALTRSAVRTLAGGQASHASQTRGFSRRHPPAAHACSTDISGDSAMSDSGPDSQTDSSDTPYSGSDSPSPRPKQMLRRSIRNGTDQSYQRCSPRRKTNRNAATRKGMHDTTPIKKAASTARNKSNLHRRRISSGSYVKPLDNSLHSADEKPLPTVPNWLDPRMPYDCWVNIFLYAGSEGNTDCPNTSWLLNAATVCKGFAEAALTAIYRCPIIRTPTKAKRLACLLERDPAETLFKYRAKVEYFHIDIHIVPQAVLFPLIHHLPRLKELVIFTPFDQPPYRKLDTNVRWHYPEDIFKAFLPSSMGEDSGSKPYATKLRSWEWSGRLIGGYVASVNDIAHLHQTPSFAHLTRVSFTNFQVPSLRTVTVAKGKEDDLQNEREDDLMIEAVGRAISELKFLKHLIFESSTVMNSRLLPLLPTNLHHLELINCWEVTSEDLAPFLRTHGSQLRTLSLLHNQSLNLAFLTDLADTCPKLRVLHMNMSYYRHHDTVNDSDPMYDFSLLPYQVPSWPSSLRALNIEHIRNWDQATAEMFLESIRESSDKLPNLRYLAIKTMLDIPWQARAELRSKWRLEMEGVFLRPFVPPRDSRGANALEQGPPSRKRKRGTQPASPSRRSGRIADSAHLGRPLYRDPDTDDDEFDTSEDGDVSMSEVESRSSVPCEASSDSFIQGLCDTVSITFDNQKPRELQYSMEDFLEDDEESEEEWNGDDADDDEIAF